MAIFAARWPMNGQLRFVTGHQLDRGGARITGDRYYTPDHLARRVVAAVNALEPIEGIAWDPHLGGGAFARALLRLLDPRQVWGTDIDPDAPGLSRRAYRPDRFILPGNRRVCDFFAHPGIHDCEWIFGNPPFDEAERHIERALALAPRVVFLLRVAILAGEGRGRRLWSSAPLRHVWTLAGRPSFTADGRTDRYDYAVLFFDRNHTGPAGLTPGWLWRSAPDLEGP